MDDALRAAVALFNDGRFSSFQDALEAMTSQTRAPSERQFYALLKNLAEALLQLSDGDLADAEHMIAASLRKLDVFLPRYRGLNVEALREDFRRVLVEIRESLAGKREEHAPSRLPRLRVLPE
ncbi:MAG TPA: hypothetical protein VII13_01665 [Vicinamibacteria bacterium]|jgi:hypothetical protein